MTRTIQRSLGKTLTKIASVVTLNENMAWYRVVRCTRTLSIAMSPVNSGVEIHVSLNFRHSTLNSAQRTLAAESHSAQALQPKPSSTGLGWACHRERPGRRVIRPGSAMKPHSFSPLFGVRAVALPCKYPVGRQQIALSRRSLGTLETPRMGAVANVCIRAFT